MKPRVLILHADGTNRDHEAAQAFELAGALAEIVHINQLRARAKRWQAYHVLALPGGFSYADALSAGKLLALDLNVYFTDEVRTFIETGKPVIGICNGFQALVKAGLLPSPQTGSEVGSEGTATLTFNESGHFECRWVTLKPQSQACVWTRGLAELIECPVAHGEGSFTLANAGDAQLLRDRDQIAMVYARSDSSPANGAYPDNPNGSIADIAGICTPRGNVLGLMPHPEDHVLAYQHPRRTRGECGHMGLKLFEKGVKYAAQL
jgi:phosphoribosylformylglycinamidine synthase I